MSDRIRRDAFTLVEILIVVVILGVLAAIVVPMFAEATDEAANNTTLNELQKLRRHIGVYQARNDGQLPEVEEGDGTWGGLVGSDYLMEPPVNSWVGGANDRTIIFRGTPDLAYQTDYGWIFDPATGEIWAGGFDSNDRPLAR